MRESVAVEFAAGQRGGVYGIKLIPGSRVVGCVRGFDDDCSGADRSIAFNQPIDLPAIVERDGATRARRRIF